MIMAEQEMGGLWLLEFSRVSKYSRWPQCYV